MMFTVSVEATTHHPLTLTDLDDLVDGLVDHGACITGRPDEPDFGATMTVEADDAILAGQIAVARISDIITPKLIVGCEALTVEEFDRRQALVKC